MVIYNNFHIANGRSYGLNHKSECFERDFPDEIWSLFDTSASHKILVFPRSCMHAFTIYNRWPILIDNFLLLVHTQIRLSFVPFFLLFHFLSCWRFCGTHNRSLYFESIFELFCSGNLFDCFSHPVWVTEHFLFFFSGCRTYSERSFVQCFSSNFNTKRALNSIFTTSNIFTYARTHTHVRQHIHRDTISIDVR